MAEGLTNVQIEFLKILESFMHEKEYRFPEGFTEAEELYRMAAIHKMIAAVYEQTRQDNLFRQKEYAPIANIFKRSTIQEVMMQTQRADGFLHVYRKLCEQGLRPLVVKGIICRNLYAKPDYRVSGDEDVLIKEEDFAICDEILREEGFDREAIDLKNLPYEIPYMNRKNGVYIELHFALFPDSSGAYGHLNQEFVKVYDSCIIEEIQGTKVWTLSPTMHLFYLICHSFKHFLHSGFGIRQVCDMVMMAEHYGARINWGYIEKRLKKLRMDGFFSGLVQIGTKYLGFSPEKANYPQKGEKYEGDCFNLLKDILNGGIYGDSTMERKHSSNMTLAAAEKGKKDTVGSLRASLFPGKEYMKKTYPWLKKHPWLLPAAWGIRIVRYLGKKKKEDKKEAGGVEIGMNRVELMREYHIIK